MKHVIWAVLAAFALALCFQPGSAQAAHTPPHIIQGELGKVRPNPAPKPTNAKNFIGESRAKQIALSDARISSSNVRGIEAKLENTNKDAFYRVVFSSQTKRYSYEINAVNGGVRKRDVRDLKPAGGSDKKPGAQDGKKPPQNWNRPNDGHRPSDENKNNNRRLIGENEAKNIALKHAGINSAASAKFREVRLYDRQERPYYRIKFHKGNTDYDYEIDARRGNILRHSTSGKNQNLGNGQVKDDKYNGQRLIGESRAKQIAMRHAGVRSSAQFYEFRTEVNDNRPVYKLAFFKDNDDYRYHIDALSGRILQYSKDRK